MSIGCGYAAQGFVLLVICWRFVSCDWSETRISDIVSILKEETFK
jgi:hypothetical protein